jgi:hypothetical protein
LYVERVPGLGLLFAPLHMLPQRRGCPEITVMDIKLALLFLFVSTMITLSNLNDENVERIKQQMLRWQWREFSLRRTKL